jgi:hypothetical protein
VTDERIDLSSLDPGRDPDRIGRIVGAVRSGIAERELGQPWAAPLARVWIPALLAAAVAGVLAAAAPRIAGRGAAVGGADPLAISLGVPVPLALWAAAEEPPTATDVLDVMESWPR